MTRDYLTLSDTEAETAIFTRMRTLDENAKLSFAEIGLMCSEVKRRELWQHRTDPEIGFPCRSFTRWMRIAAEFSYSNAFAALVRVEELLGDIPASDIAQISSGNLSTLQSLSTAVRSDPEVLEAAKAKKPAEFIEHIQAKHPEQHIERHKPITLMPTETQREEIDQALVNAKIRGDATSLTDLVWQLAVEYNGKEMPVEEVYAGVIQ